VKSENSILAPSSRSHWSIGRRVIDTLDPDLFTTLSLDTLIKRSHYDELVDSHKTDRPVGIIYIYCAPCACLMATALEICRQASTRANAFFSFLIRPDDRLASSCCSNADRGIGLVSLVEGIRNYEITASSSLEDLEFVDKQWIEKRLFEIDELDQVQPSTDISEMARGIFKSHESSKKSTIIILGELDYCLPIMHCPPFPLKPRIARETEIFQMQAERSGDQNLWRRKYLGTYTPKPLSPSAASERRSVAGARQRSLNTQNSMSLTSTSLDSMHPTTHQISPPPSPAAKRQKSLPSSSVAVEDVVKGPADIVTGLSPSQLSASVELSAVPRDDQSDAATDVLAPM
jgi:hypothetical protein